MARAATFGQTRATPRSVPAERALAGALSGVAAGLVFAVLSMIYAAVVGPGLWAPPRMIATIVGFAMAPAFAPAAVAVGLGLHMILSALYGAVFAVAIGSATRAVVLAAGLLFGLALYVVNFHGFAQIDQFAAFRMMAGNWFEIAVHAVFGVLLAAGYLWWRGEQSLES
jgi:hypothetical protein